jgi:hypothetical protein
MMKSPTILLVALFATSQVPSFAEDRIQLDQTTVIDNHELPKITYIVPWQAAPPPDQEKPPLDALIDDALAPLDRAVLRGQIQYYYEATPAAPARDKPAGKATH